MSTLSLAGHPAPRRSSPDPEVGAGFWALMLAVERCWSEGRLDLIGPDGAVRLFDGRAPGPAATISVRDGRSFVRRLLREGDVGFAESYIAGEWDSPDLAALLTVLSQNFDNMARVLRGQWWLRAANALAHAFNRNSRAGSRRNIYAHYDLGEDFYRLWLDAGLNYSAALYEPAGLDLTAAQHAKHAALADTMDLRPGQSVLEIGCGWGAFAVYAASQRGARVTAITLSPAQHAFASARVQAEGLGERVEVKLCDYRDVEGRFDRVASIEMFEAVGESYWPSFFDKVHGVLGPDGRAGLQIITIHDALFDDYRRRPDFIQLHVFPGGMLPSESALRRETERAGLACTHVRRFGQDYADTLAQWMKRYQAQRPQIRALGFDDRFDRLWRYYLAYCEAGFRTRRTDVIQLGLARA